MQWHQGELTSTLERSKMLYILQEGPEWKQGISDALEKEITHAELNEGGKHELVQSLCYLGVYIWAGGSVDAIVTTKT